MIGSKSKLLLPIFAVVCVAGFTHEADDKSARYQKQFEALCKKLEACEKEIGEGNYYYCQLRMLKEFETFEATLIVEVEADLPKDKISSFRNVDNQWKRYYFSEKKHRERMQPHQPVVQSIGYLMDLVEILKARCRMLVRQLA